MDAVEAAVGHDGDDITLAELGGEVCDDGVRAVEAEGGLAALVDRADERVGVEELAVDAPALAREDRLDQAVLLIPVLEEEAAALLSALDALREGA